MSEPTGVAKAVRTASKAARSIEARWRRLIAADESMLSGHSLSVAPPSIGSRTPFT